MEIGIVQWVFISLILIILIHHLFSFFKNTLTVPKVKDMVNKPTILYKEIEDTLNKSKNTENLSIKNEKIDKVDMKNELKNFFNELGQQNISGTSNFSKNLYAEL